MTTFRRLASAVLVALSLVPVLADPAGAAPLPVTADRGPLARAGQTARVAVVGDSLTVGSAAELDRLLAAHSFALDARVGRATPEAPAALDRVRASSADVVVLALGTNDASNASRYPALVAAALGRVNPVAHLVWVLPHRFVPEMDPVRAAIVTAVGRRPHSTTLDDDALWADPSLRAGDGLHFNAAGYRARARMVAGAVGTSLASVTGFAASATGGSWLATGAGRVTGLAGARGLGDAASLPLDRPVVGMAATASGRGYWLVAADGGIFSFGDAAFFGSTGGLLLDAPVLAMAATPTGRGYWLLAADGGIFSFGDAAFFGSTGGRTIPAPAVELAATDGGYLVAGTDGSVYPFGGARTHGSTLGVRLEAPVVGIARVPGSDSYWLIAGDGGVFSFGPDARFFGSTGALDPAPVVVGLAPHAGGLGYTVVGGDGRLYDFP